MISEIEEYLKKIDGIKNFHVSIKKNTTTTWHIRDTLMIRLWVNKDVFEAQKLMIQMSENESFENKVKIICRGNVVPQYDIYFV